MYSFTDPGLPLTRGADGPVTCAVCGCRLTQDGAGQDRGWVHFHPFAGHDARGCRVACVDLPHDRNGAPLRQS
jgi:hypothetical protein